MIKQNLLHMVSAYTTEPGNLGVEAPSSEGKTHPTVETSKLFPSADVLYLVGLSPTALAHDHGVLVDFETKEPLQPKLREIDIELSSLNGRKKEDKQRIRELKAKRAELLANSAYLVNLENKILLFLDKPHPETLQRLYPILSHDVYESTYKFTDRKGRGPLRSVNVILHGWPVAVYCRTLGEKDPDLWEQTTSRFTTTSPRMNPRKYREAVKLKATTRGLPGPILVKKLRLDQEDWARRALTRVREKLVSIKEAVRSETGYPKASMFWIPFYEKIGEGFPADVGRRMRDSDRFLASLQSHAAINVFSRPRLVFPNGTEYIICTREDYDEVTGLFFNEEDKLTILTGLSRNVIIFFQKVVLPLWREKKSEGLTASDLVDGCIRNLKKSLSDNTIRRHYIKPLENAGFISYEQDPNNKVRKLVKVLKVDVEETGKNVLLPNALNFSLEDLKKAWKELTQICASEPPPKIINYDGRELTLEELYEMYYQETGNDAHIEKERKQAVTEEQDVEKTGKNEKHGNARFIGRINLDLKRIKSVEKFKKPLPPAFCDNCCLEKTQKRIITHRALTFTDEVLFLCGDCADLIIKAKMKEESS